MRAQLLEKELGKYCLFGGIFKSSYRIYTTMMGKKSSLNEIEKYLTKEKNITNISTTQFCQGNTMRWAIAWSLDGKQLNQFKFGKFEKKESKFHASKPLKLLIDRTIFEIETINDFFDSYEIIKEFIVRNLKVQKI